MKAQSNGFPIQPWFAALVVAVASLVFSLPALSGEARLPPGISEKSATVNGVRINYKIAGSGPPVVLLHGYAETSHMWLPLMPLLANTHTVIAPDLRGAGDSQRTASGYDKKTMAQDIHELVQQLAHKEKVQVVGHDIGLMVAYAYAAQYPDEVNKIVLMDAFLPGIGDWTQVWLLRDLWHFHFHGATALALVKGRERIYFEHFWNDFAADKTKSVPEADRKLYAAAYARADGMRAGFQYFKSFEQDAKDFAEFSRTKLAMPMLVLTGEKASGNFLIDQARLVATSVQGVVIKGSGHWLMEEAPRQVIPQLLAFLDEPTPAISSQRLSAGEIEALTPNVAALGTSGVSGIQTRVLMGDPARPGAYTIQLTVPANTRIEAHDHPDDRAGSVIAGIWYFGYGTHYDEKALKKLLPGGFYVEPSNKPHFARTGSEPAIIHIYGSGPSGTRYSVGSKLPAVNK